ncbi:DUF885 domain-containing protein [Caulobacter segnis]|uniref:DUF885 domain-containing protein n=1 Tax=Caulobacter segnis TaxID=88688 RepID=UPI0024105BB6|nr:DUF885 domain-containing protein [Caulobacter segnis]MDG2521936.1 DUF885 domain-containing protein [Caulobacter segnis]
MIENQDQLSARMLLGRRSLLAGAAGLFAAQPLTVLALEAGSDAETARLNTWLNAQYEEALDLSPMMRSYAGDKKDYDKIDDVSEDAMTAALAWRRTSTETLKRQFDRSKLSQEGRTSYDLWVVEYEMAAAADKFRRNEYVFSQVFGSHTSFAQFLIAIHKVDEPADMDAYVARISGLSRALGQRLDTAKLNAAGGVRSPRYAYDAVIKQAGSLSSGAPFDAGPDNSVWADVKAKADGLVKAGKIDQAAADRYKQAARKALIEDWGPAYQNLVAWLQADRPNTAEIATGVGRDPNGAAFYAERLAASTTTDLTAEQIHQIGLSEVARIKGEMETIKRQVGFTGSLQDFFVYMREDDRFYYPNTDEGRQAFIKAATDHLAFMKTRLPAYFGVLPKADVVVKRVEAYREVAGAPQHYLIGSRDGARPGVFYAHMSDMRSLPIPQLEVITYHEGNPGHHMQFSIAQELTDVPKFRTQLYYNATQEGWGLYTEQLAKEMGAYKDPYSDFGRLTTEIWRAIRLVVDTGLHSKGWTEEEAVSYFKANSPASESQIRAEVQRYIVMPGQATGYKIGMIRILQMRKKAEAALGPSFDIRGFHDTILGGGQMTLVLLEQRIDQWVASHKAA